MAVLISSDGLIISAEFGSIKFSELSYVAESCSTKFSELSYVDLAGLYRQYSE